MAWFIGQGIEGQRVLSDNRSAYKPNDWRKDTEAMGLKVKKTRPYTTRTNGKAERFFKTLLEEWTDVIPLGTSAVRNELLTAYLRIHNARSCRRALDWACPPPSGARSAAGMNNPVANHN